VSLTLGPDVLEQVIAHLRACLPREGCGLIAGSQGVGTRVVTMTNTSSSRTEFEMDPAELISALRAFRDNAEEMVAIYHSHPHGPPAPSARDISRAYYPEAMHLIVSFADARTPVSRAFRIVEGEVFPIELRAIV
jgi:proteasome lid subunit RPN8/RPN11